MAARLTAYIVAAIVGATLVAGLIVGAQRAEDNEPADLIVYNAKVYTGGASGVQEAVAVRGNRILRVGSNRDVRRLARWSTVQIDARGGTVLPGFTDGHTHLVAGGLSLDQLDLREAVTLDELRARIRTFAQAHPDRPWVLGRGWSYALFPGGLPTRQMLDALVPDRPAHLVAFDGHAAWVNSRALRLAGITRRTPNPRQGVIVKDPRTGEPTGVLKEAAQRLMATVLPPVTREERLRALRRAIREAHRLGVTSVHDVETTEADLALLDELRRTGELTLRVSAALAVDEQLDEAGFGRLEALRRRYGEDALLRTGAVALVLDGAIDTAGAALLEPYATRWRRGALRYTPDEFAAIVSRLDSGAWQLVVEAQGDRAVRLALDTFEALADAPAPPRGRRHRIERIELVDPADRPRIGRLGVVASLQPGLGAQEPPRKALWLALLGRERAARSGMVRSLREAGARIVFGSDWPASPLDPRYGLYAAVAGRLPEGDAPDAAPRDERLPLAAALDAYTSEAAYAGFAEDRLGRLAPGMLADLVVLSTDLFSLPPERLLEAVVAITIFDGKIVYTRERETTEP
jgi:predicted amidohydrolase YtcJ